MGNDLQNQIKAWRKSQPDLINCPLCAEPITLTSCQKRLAGKNHVWHKIDGSLPPDALEVAESFWRCMDSGCKYYELPDKSRRPHCFKHGNPHHRPVGEIMT